MMCKITNIECSECQPVCGSMDDVEDIDICERCEMLEEIIIARNEQIKKLYEELDRAKEAIKVKMFDDESVAEYLEDKKNKEKYKKIYMAALEEYGEEAQITMVFEEMSELQKELCKYLRSAYPRNIEMVVHIAEEIADVEIMLEQMKLLFEIDNAVEEFKSIKVDRLKERLKL